MKDLTGKGKPFHSALDKAAALLKRKVGTGAEFMQELKGLGGIKQAEMDERKLNEVMGMPRMTHDQFMANLAMRPVPKIREKVLGGDQDDPNWIGPYHHKWTLPGGENYREMLIKLPDQRYDMDTQRFELDAKLRRAAPEDSAAIIQQIEELRDKYNQTPEVFEGVGQHFGGEPGILASLRLKDRTGPNGEKLLHLEELQSDWHQKGREGGYGSRLTPEDEAKIADFEARQRHQANPVGEPLTLADRADWAALIKKREGSVPDAPFKKNWEEMALKRLVHHAAEKGYNGIVVTNGKDQADRYSLAKYIDDLHYSGSNLVAYDGEGNEVIKQTGVRPQDLPELVGKELADKLMAQEPQGTLRSLRGVDMEVGGEGMKGFYDKKVPNILNSIGKKYGVKTELNGHKLKISDDLNFPEETSRRNNLPSFVAGETKDVHHFPITEDMRKDILTNGLPLYKEGGIIRKAEGGNVQLSVDQMRQQLMSAGKGLADISQIGAQEAPNMPVKNFVIPQNGAQGSMPMGGVDMSPMQPGQQMLPSNALQPNPLMPQQPDQQQGGAPLGGMPPPPPAGGSNILQMTPQGQALAAMRPPIQKAGGGEVSNLPPMIKVNATDNGQIDNGALTFNMDNFQELAKGGGVHGYASKGYVTHTPTKPNPVVGTRFTATPQGNLVKDKPFSFEDYENKGSIINSPYDATTRDNLVSQVSGHNLINPLLTEAGFRYSLDKKHVKQDIGGASNLGIAGRQQGRVDQAFQEHGGDVFMIPSTMSDSDKVKDYPENFSHHPTHILLDLMKQRQFNKKILKQISDDLRSQHELVENKKTGKKVKAYPYKNFLGFDHPLAEEQLIKGGYGLDTTAGNLRKKMVERLGSVAMQKLLDYNIGDVRGAILDPDIATDPKGFMGAVVVKGKPKAALRQSASTSYDTDLYGKYKGGFKNRPIEIVQPDVYSSIDAELRAMPKNKGKSEASIRAQVIGAIEKRKEKIAQPINARVINNAGLYEEGLKQGEFDPKNLESILGYYKRKGGYKKGGGVKKSNVTDNLDTMRLALTRNKKAK